MEFNLLPRIHLREMHARGHLVHSPGQRPEHLLCIGFIAWFSQRASFQPNEGIGPDHDGVWMTRCNFERLGAGVGHDQGGQVQRRIVDFQPQGGIG